MISEVRELAVFDQNSCIWLRPVGSDAIGDLETQFRPAESDTLNGQGVPGPSSSTANRMMMSFASLVLRAVEQELV